LKKLSLLKNSVKKHSKTNYKIILLVFALAFTTICYGKELYKQSEQEKESAFTTLSNLELQVYRKDYSLENLAARIERLEITIYGHKSNESLQSRLDEIKKTLNAQNVKECDDKNEIMLSLLEKKYFNTNYPLEANEKRLSRLETQIYGKPSFGDVKFRLSNLFQKVPLNTTGISLSDKSGSNVIYMPTKHIKKYENLLPKAEYANADTRKSNSLHETYSKYNLLWKSSPVMVFVVPSKDLYFKECALKAVNFWKAYYNIELTSNAYVNDIIIDLNDKELFTVVANTPPPKNSRAYIHAGRYLKSEYLQNILSHELGHAIGIWEHSANPGDIMYDFKEVRFDIERRGDINSTRNSIKYAPDKPSGKDLEALLRVL
jgi:hypothetical protein